jgi:hypothetical protein
MVQQEGEGTSAGGGGREGGVGTEPAGSTQGVAVKPVDDLSLQVVVPVRELGDPCGFQQLHVAGFDELGQHLQQVQLAPAHMPGAEDGSQFFKCFGVFVHGVTLP